MTRAPQSRLTAAPRAAPPLPHGFLQRPRVDALLDDGAARRMTLICAPAGSGKTLLVSSWARRDARRGHVAWVDCAWLRRTSAAFWEAFVAAVDDVAAPASPGRGGSAPLDRTEMLDRLIGRLAAIPGRIVIVLDDLHRLSASDTHRELQYVVDRIPDNVTVMMLSRTVPPLALYRARIEDRILDLRSDDLAFTVTETAELLHANDLDLPPTAVELLHEQTQGWAAGLRLAMMSMRQTGDPVGVIDRLQRSSDALSAYLTEQVLAELDSDVVDFLFDTCVADRLTESLVVRLTGAPGAARRLQLVADRVGFLTRESDDDETYRYHPMFAEILRRQLQFADPTRIADRYGRAVRWYREHGEPLAAADAAIRCGEPDLACEVLVTDLVDLAGRGYLLELAAALDRLPQEFRDGDVRAQLVAAIIAAMGEHPEQADRLLERARRHLPDDEGLAARRLRATFAVAAALSARRRADVGGVLDALPDAEPDVPEPGDPEFRHQDQGLRVSWRGHRAVALLWDDQVGAARAVARENRELARESGSHWQELSALGVQAIAAAVAGDLAGSDACVRDFADTLSSRGWSAVSFLALAEVAGAWVAVERMDEHGAKLAIERARACSDRLPGGFIGSLQVIVEARARFLGWAVPDPNPPRPRPNEQQPLGATARLVRHLERRGQVEELLRRDDLSTAAAIADGDPGLVVLVSARAGAQVVAGSGPSLLPAVEEAVSPDLALTVRVVLAAAVTCHHSGDAFAADRLLGRALIEAETHGYVLPFTEIGAELHPLLLAAPVSALRHPELVATLIGLTAPDRPRRAAPFAQPLTPKELDVLRHLATRSQLDEIADHLYVSVNTVRTHTRNAYRKLGVMNRRDAVIRAADLGIL